MEKLNQNERIKELLIRLEEGMINYLEYDEVETEDNVSYNRADISESMNIMNNFLEEVENIDSEEKCLNLVYEVLNNLNILNEKCEKELLGKPQKEDIFKIIYSAFELKGFDSEDLDLSEKL